MTTVYALIVITSIGMSHEAAVFTTMEQCQAASAKVKLDNFCVKKEPMDPKAEINKALDLMKHMVQQFDKLDNLK
jgi:hypothetical protein